MESRRERDLSFVLVVTAVGFGWSVIRPHARAVGDQAVATELDRLTSRRMRRTAACVIDLGTNPPVRTAYLGADETTRFEIGSVTKALTGLLLADAVDRGEVTLETRISDVLPETDSTELGNIMLRELCTHTSGLPRLALTWTLIPRILLDGFLRLDPYRGTTVEHLLKAAARQKLNNRGQFKYSNLGGAVLDQILARATGRDFSVLLSDRLLDPLAMSHSGVSTRHNRAPWGWSSLGVPRMPWILGGYAPAGGVFATLPDLAALAKELLSGTASGSAALTTPLFAQNESRHLGMFWMIDTVPETTRQMVWHNGATGGYSAYLAVFPQAQRAVVVIANSARPLETEHIAIGLSRWLVGDASNA